MPTFIKTGFWDKLISNNPQQAKAPKGWLNLDQFVQTLIPPTPPGTNIYNSDGTLTGNRILDGINANNLRFFNLANFEVTTGIFNSRLQLNTANFKTLYNTQETGLKLDFGNRTYELGQITGNNATTLKIDDTAAFPVQVSGTNVTQNTSGTASGKFLKIKVDGVDYVIELKNPS